VLHVDERRKPLGASDFSFLLEAQRLGSTRTDTRQPNEEHSPACQCVSRLSGCSLGAVPAGAAGGPGEAAARPSHRAAASLAESLEPTHPVGDGVQQPLGGGMRSLVAGGYEFPGVAARVCGGFGEPSSAVDAVIVEDLTGPLARDRDTAPSVAEAPTAERFALTAGDRRPWRVFGLDAVAEPVRVRRRARLIAQGSTLA
jgi:hypothetical protein